MKLFVFPHSQYKLGIIVSSMPKLHSNKPVQIMSNYICRSSIYHLGNQKSASSIFHLENHSSSISRKINKFYLQETIQFGNPTNTLS